MPRSVTLSKSDWREVYHALDALRYSIKRGEYGDDVHPKAVDQLDDIMNAIGVDGRRAAERGVLPATRTMLRR